MLTPTTYPCSIWNGATLAAFIYMVQGNSNKSVGIAEGIFGTFCAAAGIPVSTRWPSQLLLVRVCEHHPQGVTLMSMGMQLGWLADRYRRDHTLRCTRHLAIAWSGLLTCRLKVFSTCHAAVGSDRLHES